MGRMGTLLVVAGLATGLALSAFLYQWDSVQRALEASPTPASEGSGALTVSSGASPVATASPGKGGTADAGGGKAVFNSFCNGCHPNGGAGVGPAVTGFSEDAARAAIRKGKGSMPAFGEAQISESQMAELLAYIKGLK